MNQFLKNGCRVKADCQERIVLAITAAISVALSTGTIAAFLYVLIALGSLLSSSTSYAQAAPPASVQLQAGIEKENVDGDLKAAMSIYENIASDASAPREVRAKALLRLAGCEEKLGKQAKQVYEQIVRDYADQPAASQARTRLAAIKQQEHPAAPTSMTLRKIEQSRLIESGLIQKIGASDTDGQRALYRGSSGNLFFGDLAGRSQRMIFKAKPDDPYGFVPSRDFSMVEVGLPSHHPATLAVIKTDGTGFRELVRDDAQGSIFGSDWGGTADWSWDNRYLLLRSKSQKGSSYLWVISVADGQRRELLRLETGEILKAVLSPDSRFVAYEIAPQPGQVGAFRIFIVPVQGGASRLLYESNPRSRLPWWAESQDLLDWTADSRYLAIADSRYGQAALYLYPVKNGTSGEPPVLVRQGHFSNGYTTAAGALVYETHKPGGNTQVHLASFDPEGHLGTWRRLDLSHGNPFNPWPSFSPDGSQIAYTAADEDMAGADLFLHNLSTGQERRLHNFSEGATYCHFAAHFARLFCTSYETGRGTTDLFSVAANSGEVQRLATFPELRYIVGPSNDDQALYFLVLSDPTREDDGSIARWELATGQETIVSASPSSLPGTLSVTSLDDRWLVQRSAKGFLARPISGGEWKALASVRSRLSGHFVTTPDGNWVLYHDIDLDGKQSLFRVPITGGQPQRLGDFPSEEFSGTLNFSSDGRQILAVTFSPIWNDLWILENFEPPVKQ